MTSDLAEHDPLMDDGLGGGSVILWGWQLNVSGLIEVWDRVHVRCMTWLQNCCVYRLGTVITHRKEQHTNNWSWTPKTDSDISEKVRINYRARVYSWWGNNRKLCWKSLPSLNKVVTCVSILRNYIIAGDDYCQQYLNQLIFMPWIPLMWSMTQRENLGLVRVEL